MVDAGIIAGIVVGPLVLLVINIIIMAKFLDPAATKGHYIAKIMIVSRRRWG